MTTRAKHLEWCKKRAYSYLDEGEIQSAVLSMVSDMSKHPETQSSVSEGIFKVATWVICCNDINEARKFVDGFN
jgi:hypothetical protein